LAVALSVDGAVESGATTLRYGHGSNSYELTLATLVQKNVAMAHGTEPGSGTQRIWRVINAAGRELVRGVGRPPGTAST
jgi:hypothetical protein